MMMATAYMAKGVGGATRVVARIVEVERRVRVVSGVVITVAESVAVEVDVLRVVLTSVTIAVD